MCEEVVSLKYQRKVNRQEGRERERERERVRERERESESETFKKKGERGRNVK